jgi:hypothetical protein
MNKTFLNFNDQAVASGVLQTSPELARELKAATEQFILLAKASGNQSEDEHSDSEMEEPAPKPSKALPGKVNTEHHKSLSTSASSHSPEPQTDPVDIGMGYSIMFDGSTSAQAPAPIHVSSREFSDAVQLHNATTLGRYDETMANFGVFQYNAPTSSGAMLAVAAPSNSQYQQYNVQVPSPSGMHVPPLVKSIPIDYTYSFQETTFARRLHRAALERGFHLLSNAEQRPHAYSRVFKLSLMYHTRDHLITKFRAALAKSPGLSIETYQTPFIHLGGAGLHYNTEHVTNGYILKPGPVQRYVTLESVDGTGMAQEIEFDMKDYEGEWFDSNDVEGYLRSKGIHIDPQSTFVEGQLEADIVTSSQGSPTPADIFSSPSPSASNLSPNPSTPKTVQETANWGEIGVWDSGASWNTTAAGWLMGSGDKTPDFPTSDWTGVANSASWGYSNTVGVGPSSDYNNYGATHLAREPTLKVVAKKTVTIDVSKLIDGKSESVTSLEKPVNQSQLQNSPRLVYV